MGWLNRIGLLTAFVGLGGCTVETQREPVGHSSAAITVCATGTVVQGVDVTSCVREESVAGTLGAPQHLLALP